MKRQTIIVIITPAKTECWGNFKKACEEFNFPYHSLKMKKFPIVYNDATIYKVPFNKNNG